MKFQLMASARRIDSRERGGPVQSRANMSDQDWLIVPDEVFFPQVIDLSPMAGTMFWRRNADEDLDRGKLGEPL